MFWKRLAFSFGMVLEYTACASINSIDAYALIELYSLQDRLDAAQRQMFPMEITQ